MCSHTQKPYGKERFLSDFVIPLNQGRLVASMKCFLEKGSYGDDPNVDCLMCGCEESICDAALSESRREPVLVAAAMAAQSNSQTLNACRLRKR